MNIRLTLDKFGRIVIPKRLREELHLQPGDVLEMIATGEELTLRPAREASITRERGVWVLRTGHPMSPSAPETVLRQIRDERDRGSSDGGE